MQELLMSLFLRGYCKLADNSKVLPEAVEEC